MPYKIEITCPEGQLESTCAKLLSVGLFPKIAGRLITAKVATETEKLEVPHASSLDLVKAKKAAPIAVGSKKRKATFLREAILLELQHDVLKSSSICAFVMHKHTELSEPRVRATLACMVRDNTLRRDKNGRYRVATQGDI